MKIIHAADLHIDSPLRGLGRIEGAPTEVLRRATRHALSNLVGLCLEEEVELLLLAGDLFDGEWKDMNTGLFLVREFQRLRDVGTRVVCLRGNHDAASVVQRSIRWPDHVRELSTKEAETVRFEDLGVAVHGRGFPTQAVHENLVDGYPPAEPGVLNIGLLHTNATGSSEHAAYAPCTVGQLVDHGYDYWALGHVHERQVLNEAPWVVYPGNLQGRHVRETGPKGAMVLEVDDGVIRGVDFRALDVVRWAVVDADVSEAAGDEDVAEAVAEAMEGALGEAEGRPVVARVRLVGTSDLRDWWVDRRDRLAAVVRERAFDIGDVWLEKLRVEVTPRSEAADGLASELSGLIEEEIAALRDDDDAGSLEEAVADLRKKAGSHLLTADRSWKDDWVAPALDDVAGLLRARLSVGDPDAADPEAGP